MHSWTPDTPSLSGSSSEFPVKFHIYLSSVESRTRFLPIDCECFRFGRTPPTISVARLPLRFRGWKIQLFTPN